MASLKETVERIRKASQNRIVPDNGGKVKIEILTEAGWITAVPNVTRNIAEDIIRQATNRVILG